MGVTPREFRALSNRERVVLLERVFGHKNQILQQAKINVYMDKNQNQVSEFMTQIATRNSGSEK